MNQKQVKYQRAPIKYFYVKGFKLFISNIKYFIPSLIFSILFKFLYNTAIQWTQWKTVMSLEEVFIMLAIYIMPFLLYASAYVTQYSIGLSIVYKDSKINTPFKSILNIKNLELLPLPTSQKLQFWLTSFKITVLTIVLSLLSFCKFMKIYQKYTQSNYILTDAYLAQKKKDLHPLKSMLKSEQLMQGKLWEHFLLFLSTIVFDFLYWNLFITGSIQYLPLFFFRPLSIVIHATYYLYLKQLESNKIIKVTQTTENKIHQKTTKIQERPEIRTTDSQNAQKDKEEQTKKDEKMLIPQKEQQSQQLPLVQCYQSDEETQMKQTTKNQ